MDIEDDLTINVKLSRSISKCIYIGFSILVKKVKQSTNYFFFPLSLLLSSSSPSNILALFLPMGVLEYLASISL